MDLKSRKELKQDYENGLRSGTIKYDPDKNFDENYEEWKYETGRHDKEDYDWH